MKLIVLILITLWTVLFTNGQTLTEKGKVNLRVFNDQKQPLENTTVELLRNKDSVLVKTALSDKSGHVEFDNLFHATYLIRMSTVNHAVKYSEPFTIDAASISINLPDASLTPRSATEMQGVTVTAKKPFIQKLNDRIVVNVEGSAVNAGSSAMDVLERSPGITVDQNDNISLRGKSELLNHLIINRNFYENGIFKGSDDKDNYAAMVFQSHTARFGADFFPSQKTIIGSPFITKDSSSNCITKGVPMLIK